jgi:hypothetical protein
MMVQSVFCATILDGIGDCIILMIYVNTVIGFLWCGGKFLVNLACGQSRHCFGFLQQCGCFVRSGGVLSFVEISVGLI